LGTTFAYLSHSRHARRLPQKSRALVGAGARGIDRRGRLRNEFSQDGIGIEGWRLLVPHIFRELVPWLDLSLSRFGRRVERESAITTGAENEDSRRCSFFRDADRVRWRDRLQPLEEAP
jgi:hypothetical protein